MKILSRKDDYKATAKANKNAKTYKDEKQDSLTEKKDKKTKAYKNPARSTAGKVIIIILALAMAFGGLFSVIYIVLSQMGIWH